MLEHFVITRYLAYHVLTGIVYDRASYYVRNMFGYVVPDFSEMLGFLDDGPLLPIPREAEHDWNELQAWQREREGAKK